MSFLDFSDAGAQGGGPRGLIPEGALAVGRFKLKPYNAENNALSKVSSKGNRTLAAEYEIIYPDAYMGCRVFENITIDGQSEVAVRIGRAAIKAMCEARGADPDKNPDGYKVPWVGPDKDPDLRIFDGHEFPIQVSIEKGSGINPQNGKPYTDKNKVSRVLTPLDASHKELLERLASGSYDPPPLLPIEDKPAAAPATPGNVFAGRTPPAQQASTPAPAAPPPLRPAGPPATAATPPWLNRR